MRVDYSRTQYNWLRNFYDFAEKRINLLLNWRYEKLFPSPSYVEVTYMADGQLHKDIYNLATDYYVDYLEIQPRLPAKIIDGEGALACFGGNNEPLP